MPACYKVIGKLTVTAAHPTFNRAFNADDEANRQIGRGERLVSSAGGVVMTTDIERWL